MGKYALLVRRSAYYNLDRNSYELIGEKAEPCDGNCIYRMIARALYEEMAIRFYTANDVDMVITKYIRSITRTRKSVVVWLDLPYRSPEQMNAELRTQLSLPYRDGLHESDDIAFVKLPLNSLMTVPLNGEPIFIPPSSFQLLRELPLFCGL